ncbi:MAG: hypothetical protein F4123_09980 [Gemmatimonadetes bacterium]|nr:hypothetical protein [Gemmatimonadota bacterium]MYB99249.1 hypothetical protein [Gemmatimonadota bacterium]MYI46686.1 hypothetical protein [Gemmatimonadota bacterium]
MMMILGTGSGAGLIASLRAGDAIRPRSLSGMSTSVQGKDMRLAPSFATAAAVVCMQIGIPALAGPLAAQETTGDEDPVRLTVRVTDRRSEEGLLGAVIELSGVVARYVTGVDGRADVEVPPGRYTITVRRSGYEVLSGDLEVSEPGDFTLPLERVRAMDPNATATLEVRVVDHESGAGIEGARVSVLEGPSGTADSWGYVQFSGLDMLVAEVSVETGGYARRTAPVALHPFRTAAARFAMTRAADGPVPIEVRVRTRAMDGIYAGAVWRRGRRVASLTRRMLEELAAVRVSDGLATLEGFRVGRPGPDTAYLVSPRQCVLGVYVDGVNRWPDRRNRANVDVVPVSQVERVEIHLFRRGCGTVLIWTRR